jgi:mannose-6-phosphate isomerase-like protein (cupin superfamily)
MDGQRSVVEMPVVRLAGSPGSARAALQGLFAWGEDLVAGFRGLRGDSAVSCAMGRIRGLGSGMSFSGLLAGISREYPLELERPFEGVDAIAGAAWIARALGIPGRESAWLHLAFDAETVELPLHSHDCSDRLIVVLEGRGLFHWRDKDEETVQSIVVRERDVLAFRAGVVHTFSTGNEPLHLLSFHAPFVPLDASEQFTITEPEWRPEAVAGLSAIGCDPAWSVLSAGG